MSSFTEPFPASADNARIPENLRKLVNAELTTGETIRWIDQPVPVFCPKGALVLFVLGLFLIVLGIGFICVSYDIFNLNGVSIVDKEERTSTGSTGIMLLVFGLIALSVLLSERRAIKYTVYVLSDQRAMIIRKTSLALKVTSYPLADSWFVSREENAEDDTGNIYFMTKLSNEKSVSLRGLGFDNIRNVREVERLIRELKETK